MKKGLTGYLCSTLEELKTVSESTAPLLVHNQRTWYLKDSTLSTPAIDRVNTPIGYFLAIPNTTFSNNYEVQEVTVNTSNTVLDMAVSNKIIDLTLNTNTQLDILNILKNAKYILKINFNNYVITNLTSLLSLPLNINWQIVNTNYSYILLEIQLLNDIKSDIVFYGSSLNAIDYIEHTNEVVFSTNLYSDVLDSSVNNYTSYLLGEPTHVNNSLYLNNASVGYDTDSNLYLNEQDFSIEFYIHFLNITNYGTIVSKWGDKEKQFWVRITSNKVLEALFNEGLSIITLTCNLSNHLNLSLSNIHVLITRTNNIYKLFINGEIVDSIKSTNYMSNHTGDLVIGKLLSSPLSGDIGNTSFNGLIRDIKIVKNIKNNYNFYYVHPKTDTNNLVSVLIQGDLINRVGNVSPMNVSTVDTSPVLVTSDRLSENLVGNYRKVSISHLHHLEYNWFNDITGNVTIEGWIKNIDGNTRGTILYNGNDTSHNFHVGIYDNTLTCSIKDSTLVLTSNISLPSNVWVHFAFVREGSGNRLYQQGVLVASVTSTVGLKDYAMGLLCIKRYPSQSFTEASINTSLYPSKSQIYVDGIRIIKKCLYTGNSTTTSNFVLPLEFSNR